LTAIQALHANAILHRNIKPSNVILAERFDIGQQWVGLDPLMNCQWQSSWTEASGRAGLPSRRLPNPTSPPRCTFRPNRPG